jgi:hypothetical protein
MRGRPGIFTLALIAVGLTGAACNPILGPSSTDANWRIHESARFSLHVRPGSFAEQNADAIGQALDHQYDATLAALGAQFDQRVTAFLFNSADDAGLASNYSGVAYPETLAFRATAVPPLGVTLHSLLGHEANHVIIMGALGRAGTKMMNEGLASAVLSERHSSGRSYYYTWTKAHRSEIPTLARLANDSDWEQVNENIAYSASASFLAYLLETRGAVQLRSVYYADSGDFAARIAAIYGRSLGEIEADWLAFCDAFTLNSSFPAGLSGYAFSPARTFTGSVFSRSGMGQVVYRLNAHGGL